MPTGDQPIWLAAGVRSPFVAVDGPFAGRDSLMPSVPVAKAMAEKVRGPIDFAAWRAAERMNPNGGSVALGHPFAATGARILSQAVTELAGMPHGSRAIVSICADGGLGTITLLENG
jgi:acetyl-CoA acetyltransferase